MLYLALALSLWLLLLSLPAAVPLACSAGRVGEGGVGGRGSIGPGPQAGGRAWASSVGTLLGAGWECRWPTHPADDLVPSKTRIQTSDSDMDGGCIATGTEGDVEAIVWFGFRVLGCRSTAKGAASVRRHFAVLAVLGEKNFFSKTTPRPTWGV
jgi:hypothetical protein